jgi:hypothetical protein
VSKLISVGSSLLLLPLLAATALGQAAGTPPPAQPSSGLKDGWEQIDQRMVFLTVELSSVEASLAAVNRAIRAGGHTRDLRQGQAEAYRKGNELMDRNAGGPVSWDKFYGKTAESFFYHPDGRRTFYINPRPVPQRPPQLDYIYRANSDAAARAQSDVAALGDQLQLLQNKQRQLEAQQEALWCKISFQALASRELQDRPSYRFALMASPGPSAAQEVDALAASARLVAIADAAAAFAAGRLNRDAGDTFVRLADTITRWRRALTDSLLRQPQLAAQLSDGATGWGRLNADARRLDEFARNIADAHRAALDADKVGDDRHKQTMRGLLQQALMGYAEAVMRLDQAVSDLCTASHVTPDASRELKRPEFDWPPVTEAPTASASAISDVPTANAVPREIAVEASHAAKNPVDTGLHLNKGQMFVLTPNPQDTWAKGAGSRKGKFTDYRGYPGTNSGSGVTAGANWMAIKWRIGGSEGFVESGKTVLAPETAELFLFCNDDKPERNQGTIHVTVSSP